MTDTLTVHLPLPPRGLAPNTRTHWRKQRVFVREYREACRLLALEAVQQAKWKAPSRAMMEVQFGTKPNRGDGLYRPLDRDNASAAFKAGQDGLVLGGALMGDDYKRLDTHYTLVKAAGPGITVTIRPAV